MHNKAVRILQIGMSDNLGGIETYLIQQFRALNKDKIIYDFTDITQTGQICFAEEIKKYAKIYKFCSRRKNPLLHYWQWIRFLQQNKNRYTAIVLNADSLYYVFPLLVGKLFNIPHRIIHSHNSGFQIKPGFFRKLLINFNKCIVTFCATDYWACSEKAAEWMFGTGKRFNIAHNAINSKRYRFNESKRKQIRDAMQLENKFVIGHVGRFSYQKNHKFLIDIFYELQKIEPLSVLMLIGGNLNDEFLVKAKKQVKNLNIENKVLFLGICNNVDDLMQAMDCFILPSHFEGLPLVAIEAQCAGLKSYLSDVITDEVKITDLVDFISLKEAPKFWAKQILSNKNYIRKDMTDEIKKAGYDIKTEIKKIEKFYLEK